ncbi:MAG: hypothetical protein WCF85_13805 [Rhodospirillaceae bacterium]
MILKEFIEREKNEGFTRAELARRIGRKPEQLTRWLSAPGNWTLDTVSDLMLAMDGELDISRRDLGEKRLSNLPSHVLISSSSPAPGVEWKRPVSRTSFSEVSIVGT